MDSGIALDAEVINDYVSHMKLGEHVGQKKREGHLKYMILKIVKKDGKDTVACVEKGTTEDLKAACPDDSEEQMFNHVTAKLTDEEPAFVLFDLKCREKVLFFMWNPDSGKVKRKMTYSSTKGNVEKKFEGVLKINDVNDRDDLRYDAVKSAVPKKS